MVLQRKIYDFEQKFLSWKEFQYFLNKRPPQISAHSQGPKI